MTTPLRTSHLYDDPGALIAAVPGLLSFHPDDSLVLITYAGARHLDLESVLRVDLPPAAHTADVALQLCLVAINHGAAMADLIVLGGRGSDPPDRLPHRALVEHLGDLFDESRISLAHAVWASRAERGRTWWCYHDKECNGQIRDPDTSPLAAAMAIPGATTHRSRDDLAALLAPDPESLLAPRAALLDGLSTNINPDEEYAYIRTTIDGLDSTELDDLTIARLARALANHDVREACLAYPFTARAERAERLWTALTRAVPDSARADPACLLAISTYLRGEGTLAAMALDLAEAANPSHGLTRTLREVIDLGLPPRRFRLMLAESLINTDDPDPEPPSPDTPPSQPDPTSEAPSTEPTPTQPDPPHPKPADLLPEAPPADRSTTGDTPRAYDEQKPASADSSTTVPHLHTPAAPDPRPGAARPANPEDRAADPDAHRGQPSQASPSPGQQLVPAEPQSGSTKPKHAAPDTGCSHLAAAWARRAAATAGRHYQGRHRAA